MVSFNNRLRQIILLSVIIVIAVLLLKHLYMFLPGVLLAITLYILSRESYFKLTSQKKWRKGWTALLYIIGYTVIIGLPIYLAIVLVTPKLISLFNNPVEIMVAVKSFSARIEDATNMELFSSETVNTTTGYIANRCPGSLPGTSNIISHL